VESGGKMPPAGRKGKEAERILKAKYFDYCSAQVADILLLLTPDEMFVLAEDAARDSGRSGDLGYEEIVTLATERVSTKLALPSFEAWALDYQDNPDRYDQYLMGFWESELPAIPDG
jgi:hypothetical protein